MRINGILLPSDWSDDGQVTALVLATSDEAEFPIESDQSPRQLERYIRRKVVVDGELETSGLFKLHAIGFYEVDLRPNGNKANHPTGFESQTRKNREV